MKVNYLKHVGEEEVGRDCDNWLQSRDCVTGVKVPWVPHVLPRTRPDQDQVKTSATCLSTAILLASLTLQAGFHMR